MGPSWRSTAGPSWRIEDAAFRGAGTGPRHSPPLRCVCASPRLRSGIAILAVTDAIPVLAVLRALPVLLIVKILYAVHDFTTDFVARC